MEYTRYGRSSLVYGAKHTASKCSVCGKIFYSTPEHVYKIDKNTRQCSYTCYRVIDKKRREKERESYQQTARCGDSEAAKLRWQEYKGSIDYRLKLARGREDNCRRNAEYYSDRALTLPYGHERKLALKNASRWRKRMEAAQEAISSLIKEKEKENVQSSEEKTAGRHGQGDAAQDARRR